MVSQDEKENEKRFTLRMDKELFAAVEELAKRNKRSVAKEIEFLLERQLESEKNNG